jgi:fructokinase
MEVCLSLLENFKLDLLILTKGAVESIVLTRDEISVVPTPRVEVADTVGAGDSFTAAFVAALLLGKSVSDAHRLAVEASAYICTQHGAMARLPDTLVDLFKK